ncbi:exported hypothetical protein [Cupriavidus oxalaticus]|uniref:Uncharacterized protein n=1 Tax=Cupriavidus oxalaticus TaxID=96344 RepID=A0A375FQZ7_9BURK|nr:exported hypothetical protein [Cupriavidus oxalaticus]
MRQTPPARSSRATAAASSPGAGPPGAAGPWAHRKWRRVPRPRRPGCGGQKAPRPGHRALPRALPDSRSSRRQVCPGPHGRSAARWPGRHSARWRHGYRPPSDLTWCMSIAQSLCMSRQYGGRERFCVRRNINLK